MFLRFLSLSIVAFLVGAEDLSVRELADEQNNNNNYNVDYSFLSKFSLKFEGCYNVPQFFPYAQGQNNKNQNNNNNNNKRVLGGGGGQQNRAGLYYQPVVSYKLCSGTAGTLKSTCTGPQYVADLGTFVNAYTEAKMTQDSYACEKVREQSLSGCVSDDASAVTACEQTYFNKTGHGSCIQSDVEANFYPQKYLYCQKYNAYNGVNYYIGPLCSSDGQSVYLGLFTDQYCTTLDTTGAFYTANGYALPFSSKSLVSTAFYSCVDKYYALNNMCTNLYPMSAKCETGNYITSPTTSGCNYVNKVSSLQATATPTKSSGGGGGGAAAKAFAWIFFFTTVALGAYCYMLMKKTGRKVGMLGGDGFA